MKRFFSFLVCIAFSLSLIGCNKKDNNTSSINLVTSFYPIYIITMNITDGIDGINVVTIANQNTGCLHDFQLQPEDIRNIEKADAFIINGAGMESFMDKVTNEIPNLKVIDSSLGIELIPNNDNDAHHDHDEEHNHSNYNTHIWLSISNYIKQVENIRDSLISIDPNHKEQYKLNSEKYINELKILRDEINNGLENISSRDIVTFHNSFPYFAKEFNLNIAGVINSEPNSEPSAQELSNIIEIVNELSVKSIFVEPQYPLTTANIIANETNCKIYTLDSAVTGEVSKNAYINAMHSNLDVLREALS